MIDYEIFNVHLEDHRDKYVPIVHKWWKDWGWPPIDPNMLSTIGVMVKYNNEYICAGWIYQTDSLMCVSDFFISAKKKFTRNIRKESIKSLIAKLEELGKKLGFKAVYTSVRSQSLIKILLELDYGKESKTGIGDKNMTVFIKTI